MKIHKINTVNIASLLGETSIDLDGKLNDPNIFLVTGPVGSGKTTLFDAVCLGLFGATPRRPKAVSASKPDIELDPKDPRAVISTGTVEGLAEVVFSKVEKGNKRTKYRACWSVERAHKKSRLDGNFKAPERSLERFDGSEWKLLVSDEQDKVVKPFFDEVLEGMTLKEFNRAVLLPQGKFGQLLSAKEEDRAEILERVTQTDSYTKIGARAKSRFDAAKKSLEKVEDRIGENSPMTPEARTAVEQERDGAKLEVVNLGKSKDSLSKRVSWLEELTERNKDVDECKAAVVAAKEASVELEPQRLAVATNIARAPLYLLSDKVLESGAKLKTIASSIESQKSKLATQNIECKSAAVVVNEAKSELTKTRGALDLAEPKIRTGLQLASQIEETSSQVDTIKLRGDKLIAEATDKALKLSDGESALVDAESQLTAHKKEVESRPYLSVYMDKVATIVLAADELESAEAEQAITLEQVQELELEVLKYQKVMAEGKMSSEAAIEGLRLASEAVAASKSTVRTIVEMGDNETVEQVIERLRGDISRAERTGVELRHTKQQFERLSEAKVSHGIEVETLAGLEAALLQHAENVLARAGAVESATSALVVVQGTAAVDRFAMGLISERDNLSEGDRCQLCGSEDHPYVSDFDQRELSAQLRARAADSEAAETEANRALRECQSASEQATLEQASAEATTLAARGSVAAQTARIDQELKQVQASALANGLAGDLNVSAIEAAIESAGSLVVVNNEICERLIAANKDFISLQAKERTAQENLTITQGSVKLAEVSLNSTKAAKAKAESLAERVKRSVTERQEKIAVELNPFVTAVGSEVEVDELTLRETVDLLSARVDKAAAAVKLVTEVAALVAKLKSEVELAAQAHVSAKKQAVQAELELTATQSKLSGFQVELAKLFGSDTPASLEAKLKSDIESATTRQDLAVAGAKEKDSARDTLNGLIENLETQLVSLEDEMREQNIALDVKLAEVGCATLDELLVSRLSDSDLKEHQVLLRSADDDSLKANSALAQAGGTLEKHMGDLSPEWADSDEAPDSLHQRLAELTGKYDDANQLFGKLKNVLDSDDTMKSLASELLAELDECQREYNLWARMQRLIGRNDGKAFRNAAQVLNLGDLIDRANPHLKTLSGRYSLSHRLEKKKRHPKDKEGYLCPTLSFSIIDGYQADRARDIQSLGGGDSFLVSLSLALGLASYQTVKMPIETLLLDEGFGTLDQDTLHTAMQTLERIYKSNGTQVGLISHVEGLKRHIKPQVQVTKIGESGWSKVECVIVVAD